MADKLKTYELKDSKDFAKLKDNLNKVVFKQLGFAEEDFLGGKGVKAPPPDWVKVNLKTGKCLVTVTNDGKLLKLEAAGDANTKSTLGVIDLKKIADKARAKQMEANLKACGLL